MNKVTKVQSVINLYAEMERASVEPSEKYHWISSKCHRQNALASISRKGKRIEEMSLGSFKKYCNLYIDGGFDEVDLLRVKILKNFNQIETKENSQIISVSKLEIAKRKIDALSRNQAILIKAYNELNSITLDLIANTNDNSLDYQKHQDLFSSYFGLKLAVDNEE